MRARTTRILCERAATRAEADGGELESAKRIRLVQLMEQANVRIRPTTVCHRTSRLHRGLSA